MKRLLYILDFTLVSLGRRWQRNLFLLFIYSFLIGIVSSVFFFTKSLCWESTIILQNTPDIILQNLQGGRLTTVPDTVIPKIKTIRGLKRIEGRIWGYYPDYNTFAIFTIMGFEDGEEELSLVEGRLFREGENGAAIIGTGSEILYPWEDQLYLANPEGGRTAYRVIGRFKAASDLLTRDLIILSLEDARRVLGIPEGYFTDVAVWVHNKDEVINTAAKINQTYYNFRTVTGEDIRGTYYVLFGWRGGIFIFGLMISLLAFSILVWDKIKGMSKDERKEIGILKAVGWNISDIMIMKFWEGIIFSLTATLLGLIGAYFYVFTFQAPLIRRFLGGWSALYPRYQITPHVDLEGVFLIMCLSVVPYLATTIIPSWRAAIIDPVEVIQGG